MSFIYIRTLQCSAIGAHFIDHCYHRYVAAKMLQGCFSFRFEDVIIFHIRVLFQVTF